MPGVTTILSNNGYGGIPEEDKNNAIVISNFKKAGERGTAVHKATEFVDNLLRGKNIVDFKISKHVFNSIKEDYRLYVVGWINFVVEHVEKIIVIEKRIFFNQKKIRYAGTLDRVCIINGEITIVDIKTSLASEESIKMQLAAYLYGYNSMVKAEERAINIMAVHLKKDGTYKILRYRASEILQYFRKFYGLLIKFYGEKKVMSENKEIQTIEHELKNRQQQVISILNPVKDLVKGGIKDKPGLQLCIKSSTDLYSILKEIKAENKEKIEPFKIKVSEINNTYKDTLEKMQLYYDAINNAVNKYIDAQEKIRKEEENKARIEAERLAEKEREKIKEEKEALEKNKSDDFVIEQEKQLKLKEIEEREKAVAMAPAVEIKKEKVKGLSVTITYEIETVQKEMLPAKWLTVNEKALKQYAKSYRDVEPEPIPGVVFKEITKTKRTGR